MFDSIPLHGIVTIHKIPDEWSDKDFNYWWNPVLAPDGTILQPARLSDGYKRSLIVPMDDGRIEAKNLITNAGISQLLTNTGVQAQASMQPFAQIFAVGNGSITGVTRADTTLPGDGFATGSRKVPASHTNTGFNVTIATNFASTDAVGTWTNAALFGGGSATTTSGTGTMETHLLMSFTKGSTAYSVNYVFILSN